MHNQPAPAHDGRSNRSIQPDQLLRWQLEKAAGRWFYESCDGVTQSLLMDCHWYLTTKAPALTLVLDCPNLAIYGRILNHGAAIGDRLINLASKARIRLCPPADSLPADRGVPLEVWVDELSTAWKSPL